LAGPERILVLDIGKTNAKAALVEAATLAELDVVSAPNRPLAGPPYPHADVEGLWRFLIEAAATLGHRHGIDAITVTTHGATAALLAADGTLALPVLDYEHAGPDELAPAYDAARPPFDVTGTPRLPAGLNLGAQLFWQFRRFPEAAARTAAILAYPQYWTWRLSGVRAAEATSLGCHTDLWSPGARDFSPLVDREGWRALMPPLRRASDRLGPITAEVAAATGLNPATPVFCGIHDSNASLLPHLLGRPAPFAVVSTGTWVVAMAVGGRAVALDPARDTLINVSATGDPVPSARFMGGREWGRLTGGSAAPPDAAALASVVAREAMLLPAVEPGSGPFAGRPHRWTVAEAELAAGERAAVASLYLALMTGVCLEMIGAAGPIVVEGPFAANDCYTGMLAALSGRDVVAAGQSTGTSAGAALLAIEGPPPAFATRPRAAPQERAALRRYAEAWRRAVAAA
jgi:sugar (pentulose or hexulose) kinase